MSDEDEAYFALSRWERFLAFLMCIAGSAACFAISVFIGLPFLALKPRKFAVSFSFGSLLFIAGFSVLQGPLENFRHMTSSQRLPFTAAWLVSLVATLYFGLVLHSYIPTLVATLVQLVTLAAYFAAYFPGGTQTLYYAARLFSRGATTLLPV